MRLKFALVIFCCLTYLLISFGIDGSIGLLVEGGIGGTGINAEAIPVLACATVNGAKIDSIRATEKINYPKIAFIFR